MRGVVDFALAGIAPSGWMDIAAFANGVRRIVSEPDYYRCEFKNENPWNALSGYEVLLTQRRRDAERAEAFVAIEPLLKGQTSNRATLEARLKLPDGTRRELAGTLDERTPFMVEY